MTWARKKHFAFFEALKSAFAGKPTSPLDSRENHGVGPRCGACPDPQYLSEILSIPGLSVSIKEVGTIHTQIAYKDVARWGQAMEMRKGVFSVGKVPAEPIHPKGNPLLVTGPLDRNGMLVIACSAKHEPRMPQRVFDRSSIAIVVVCL